MKKNNKLRIDGIVTQSLPNATFRVKIRDNHEVLAHVSGRMRMHYIKILPGDRVVMEISPYDVSKGRIVQRV